MTEADEPAPDSAPPPTAAPAAPAAPAAGPNIKGAIAFAAKQFGVDPNVLAGMAMKESGLRPDVISGKTPSSAGAIGLMQFMPDTAKAMGIDPTNPVQSVFGAAAYLSDHLKQFGGDYGKALAAYNWGPNREALKSPDWQSKLPAETRDYVDFVSQFAKAMGSKNAPVVTPGAGRGFVNPTAASSLPSPQVDTSAAPDVQDAAPDAPMVDAMGNVQGAAPDAPPSPDAGAGRGFVNNDLTPDQVATRNESWGQTADRMIQNAGGAVASRVMQGLGAINTVVPGAAAVAVDQIHSWISGKPQTSEQDWVFKASDAFKTAQEYFAPKAEDQPTVVDKIVNGLAGMAPDLAIALSTGGASEIPATATALAGVRTMLSNGMRSMSVPAFVSGIDRAKTLIEQGAPFGEAVKAALVTGASVAITGGLPMAAGGGVAARAAQGFAVGSLMGEAQRQAENAVLSPQRQVPFSAENSIVQGLTGSVMAAGGGHPVSRGDGADVDLGYGRPLTNEQAAAQRSPQIAPADTAPTADPIHTILNAGSVEDAIKAGADAIAQPPDMSAVDRMSAILGMRRPMPKAPLPSADSDIATPALDGPMQQALRNAGLARPEVTPDVGTSNVPERLAAGGGEPAGDQPGASVASLRSEPVADALRLDNTSAEPVQDSRAAVPVGDANAGNAPAVAPTLAARLEALRSAPAEALALPSLADRVEALRARPVADTATNEPASTLARRVESLRAPEVPAQHAVGNQPTHEVPISDIKLSNDVPQFKSGSDANGVVDPLGGAFDRTGVAPIQLWRRDNGQLEVISGRHRLDLAKRSGENTIPAQIHDESAGFDQERAASLDAELNIRDGQGKVKDYVSYFRNANVTEAEANDRGLLSRAAGKRGYTIAHDGDESLIAAHRSDQVSDEAAYAIARAAPGDGRLQAVGIRAVLDGKPITQAANTMRAVKLMAGDRPASTGDMFGFDDSAMREAEQMAKIASAKQRAIGDRVAAITGAAKRPELARAEGINVRDPKAILQRAEALKQERAAWDNWSTNPDLVGQIRGEMHAPEESPSILQPHDAADLQAKATNEAAGRAADQARQKVIDDKASGDAQRGDFSLTGSDRAADANLDQGTMFSRKPEPIGARSGVGFNRGQAVANLPADVRNDPFFRPESAAMRDVHARSALWDELQKFSKDEGLDAFSLGVDNIGNIVVGGKVPAPNLKALTEFADARDVGIYVLHQSRAATTDNIPMLRGIGFEPVLGLGAYGQGRSSSTDSLPGSATFAYRPRGISEFMFNRTPNAAPDRIAALKLNETQRVADTIASKWANAPDVVVLSDMNDPRVPQSVRDADATQRSAGASGEPSAFINGGKVYIVASQMKSTRDVVQAMFHESLGHFGMRGVFGKDLNPILDRVSLLNVNQVRAKAEQYGLDFSKPNERRQASEEVLAELAQSRPENNLVQQAIAAVRTWAREHVPGFDGMKFSDAELVRSFLAPARGFVERGTGTPDGATAFSRTSDAFKKWFGDSKVVDAKGDPLVVYHGAPDARFVGQDGTFKSLKERLGMRETDPDRAFFFASDHRAAKTYADDTRAFDYQNAEPGTVAAYVSLKNPLVIDHNGQHWHGTRDAVETAKAAGNDGVIIKNVIDDYNTGAKSKPTNVYVAFDPKQIKSATGNSGAYDPSNPDIRFSRTPSADAADGTERQKGLFDPPRDAEGRARLPGAQMLDAATTRMSGMIDHVLSRADIYKLVAPMSDGTQAPRAMAQAHINAERQANDKWRSMDSEIVKTFNPEQRRSMWDAADQQNEILSRGDTPGPNEGINALPKDQRAVVDMMHDYNKQLWERGQSAELVKGDGVKYWAPRMMAMIDANGEYSRPSEPGQKATSAGEGRNIVTSASSAKQRKYNTSFETAAAMEAKGGELVRDIRTMPMAMARFERAIAGRELISGIKEHGEAIGKDYVSDVKKPGFFTMDHPSFTTYRPRMVTDADGKVTPAIDQTGKTVMDKTPIYISKEFEGPLKAIMTNSENAVYRGYMLLKSKAMSGIMFSPFIHQMVIAGRAFAYAGLKLPALYVTGHVARADNEMMQNAIGHGMVPISGTNHSMVDVGDIARGIGKVGGWGDPNESWIGLGAKAAGNAIKSGLGDTLKAGVDKAGDFVHGTLLWNRIGDLQAGIFKDAYQKGIAMGMDDNAAATDAAHMANRYAGAVGRENMSSVARQFANVLLFSRSFNMGNVGAVKDVFYGLPAGLRAQLFEGSSPESARIALSYAKRKALTGLIKDLAATVLVTSLVQDLVKRHKDDPWAKQLGDAFGGYGKRAGAMWDNIKAHPGTSDSYDPYRLSSTWGNEPGKVDRVDMGAQPSGRHEYMRLPTGKVVEDTLGWLGHPVDTFGKKMAPMAKAAAQIASNDKGYGTPVYDPSTGLTHVAMDIALHLLKAQGPFDTLRAGYDLTQGKATPLDKEKLSGNVSGLSISQGHPLGPEGAVAQQVDDRVNLSKKYVMEGVRRDLKYGDVDHAAEQLSKIGLSNVETNRIIRKEQGKIDGAVPNGRSMMKRFNTHATEDEQATMGRLGQ